MENLADLTHVDSAGNLMPLNLLALYNFRDREYLPVFNLRHSGFISAVNPEHTQVGRIRIFLQSTTDQKNDVQKI